ncbi:MAG TPA: hypothetical protein VGM01_11925 [Ktedonobacteraceae bacterium]|jgi:hypothetical protein
MLFTVLFNLFLTVCTLCFEMVFLLLPRQKILSFLPLLFRMLIIGMTLWLIFSSRKESFHTFVFCTGILLILIIVETVILLLLRSTSKKAYRLTVLLIPLSLTRTSILAFALGTGVPLWWSIISSLIGFFSLFPMLTALQVYEYNEAAWKYLATTTLLLKDPHSRKQGETWRRAYVEAGTVLRASYKKWKNESFWFVSQAVVACAFLFLSPFVVLSSYFGWLLVTTITHAG